MNSDPPLPCLGRGGHSRPGGRRHGERPAGAPNPGGWLPRLLGGADGEGGRECRGRRVMTDLPRFAAGWRASGCCFAGGVLRRSCHAQTRFEGPRPRPTPPAVSVQGECCVTSCHSEPPTVTATERSLSLDSPNPGKHSTCTRPLERGPEGPRPHVEASGACFCHPHSVRACDRLVSSADSSKVGGRGGRPGSSGAWQRRLGRAGSCTWPPGFPTRRELRAGPVYQAGRAPWAGAGDVSAPF